VRGLIMQLNRSWTYERGHTKGARVFGRRRQPFPTNKAAGIEATGVAAIQPHPADSSLLPCLPLPSTSPNQMGRVPTDLICRVQPHSCEITVRGMRGSRGAYRGISVCVHVGIYVCLSLLGNFSHL
jgi:hypothetical protein